MKKVVYNEKRTDMKIRIVERKKNDIRLICAFEDTTMQEQIEKALDLYISLYKKKLPELFKKGNIVSKNNIERL